MNARFAPAPRHPDLHLFESGGAPHLFLPNGSRIFEIDDDVVSALESALDAGGAAVPDLLARFGLAAPPFVTDEAPTSFPARALSLAISQKCNLGCSYCYAD